MENNDLFFSIFLSSMFSFDIHGGSKHKQIIPKKLGTCVRESFISSSVLQIDVYVWSWNLKRTIFMEE